MEGIVGAEAQAFRTYVTDQREQWHCNEQRWNKMFSHMDEVQARMKQLEEATERQSKMKDMAQAPPTPQAEAKVSADGGSQIDDKAVDVQQQLLKQMRANEDQLAQVCAKIETLKKSVDDRMDVKLQRMLEEINVATNRATQQFANTVIKHVEGSQEALKTHAAELSKELLSQSKKNSKQDSEDLMLSVQGKLQVAFRDVVSINDSQWHKIEQSFKQLEERFQLDRTAGPPKTDPKKYQTPNNNGEEELERLRCGNDETLRELEQLFQKAKKTETLHKESLDLVQQESYKHQTTEEAARKWRAWNEKYRHETASDDGTGSQCGSEMESELGSAFRNRIDAGTDVSSDAGSIDTLDLERQVKYMVADCEDFNSGLSTPTHYRS